MQHTNQLQFSSDFPPFPLALHANVAGQTNRLFSVWQHLARDWKLPGNEVIGFLREGKIHSFPLSSPIRIACNSFTSSSPRWIQNIYFSVQTICGTLLFSVSSLSLALKANLQISVKLRPKTKKYTAQNKHKRHRISTQDPELTIYPLSLIRRFRDCFPIEGVANRRRPPARNKGWKL